jgi:ribosomal protein S18 acetylase RimI-like enzyme
MTLTIRPLLFNDFPQWLPLWVENNQGENNKDVTTQTWQRMCEDAQPVHGLGAFEKDKLVGILHYILHPTTGSLAQACYMQDLFVPPKQRGKGIAKELLKELKKTHLREKWSRIYWVAEADNKAAQHLYKSFGSKLDFTFHVLI